jgi:hypothetical protein
MVLACHAHPRLACRRDRLVGRLLVTSLWPLLLKVAITLVMVDCNEWICIPRSDFVACEGGLLGARQVGNVLQAWLTGASKCAPHSKYDGEYRIEGGNRACSGPVVESGQLTCDILGCPAPEAGRSKCDGLWELMSSDQVIQSAWAVGQTDQGQTGSAACSFTVAFPSSRRLTSHLDHWLLGEIERELGVASRQDNRNKLDFQIRTAGDSTVNRADCMLYLVVRNTSDARLLLSPQTAQQRGPIGNEFSEAKGWPHVTTALGEWSADGTRLIHPASDASLVKVLLRLCEGSIKALLRLY